MKKVFMFAVGVAFVASLSSCKKNYVCKCTVAGITTESTEFKATKKDAEDSCTALEVSGTVSCSAEKK